MARDLLAIPISTIALESTFSTGGRILDSFQTSLTPKVIDSIKYQYMFLYVLSVIHLTFGNL